MWNVLLVHLCFKFKYLLITSLSVVHFATLEFQSQHRKKKRVVGTCAIHLSLKSFEKAQKS